MKTSSKKFHAPGEVETFAYDEWGRVSKRTRGKLAETYSYDHFGRLASKCEDGVSTSYGYNAYGQRTSRVVKDAQGSVVSEEARKYDRHGRLVEIAQDGKTVKYEYDGRNRVAKQTIDGKIVAFGYTKHGRLQSKTLLSEKGKVTELKYRYGRDGKIVARLANGQMQKYAYDLKGQLVSVTGEDGNILEKYVYDPAGNVLEKTVGGKRTTYEYDAANQLVSSTDANGNTTKYEYDAAGRLVKEGAKVYRYGYLDKVLSVTEGRTRIAYTYHVDGQLATATRSAIGKSAKKGEKAPAPETETFLWDGLALVKRGGVSYVNEPHPGGGAAVVSSKDGVMFNDILGTTLGVDGESGYAATPMTAFGDAAGGPQSLAAASPESFFTGKPLVPGLGHAFLFRNYRASLGKWQTADPLGYPDGWNQLAYCINSPLTIIDLLGCVSGDGPHVIPTGLGYEIGFLEPFDAFRLTVLLRGTCNNNYYSPKITPFLTLPEWAPNTEAQNESERDEIRLFVDGVWGTLHFQYKIVGQEHVHEYHLRCVDVWVDVMVEVRLYFKSDDEENPVIDTWGYELALQTLSCSMEKPFLQE